jgi:mono/diheme cytochrome c family protein
MAVSGEEIQMKTHKTILVLWLASMLAIPMLVAAQDSPADIFKAKCAMCHGPEGNASTSMAKNMGLKPLTDPGVKKMSDADLTALITNGKGKMPAMKGKLTDDQIGSLTKYIHSLK